ncbi:cyclase family protein [Paracoccus shanxieyensis]|uniref:Cyclase family protein n=1 Tax=Paracoccus shanxieyensis TaxID=2675752 RepID=A0A6L6IZB3_9RHOB|nr:cyclase family protein [Paracoccus shanxieyensis]MTH64951.1 cyclase family protein [Paracoccus shanxieyensis]MTH88145.1 cyclase family protein [Paracoccus shanxieyensis]
MCNACVIESVKQSMISRRSLFAGVAATGAAAIAASTLAARPALAQASGKVVDLTYVFDETFPTFDGVPGIAYEEAVNFDASGYQLWKITFFEHSGTHIDAPLHFSKDGLSVAELAPESLICPLCVIDITAKARDDANAALEAEDVEAFISAHGEIPKGACVAMNSGWGAKVATPEFRNTPDGKFAFPGFGKSATDLLAQMGVAAIASDTLSLDPGSSADFAVHNSWLPSGHYGIENLANVDQLPATGATIFVGAPKHARGTGGPARVMAVV